MPQREKLRAVGDFKQGSTNWAARVLTPVNLPTWDQVPSAFKSPVGEYPCRSLGFAKTYRSAAYKQLPLASDRGMLATITLRDPRSGYWRACLPNTQLFGGTTSALQYNRVSRITDALSTGIPEIPAIVYFEDFGLMTPPPFSGEALLVCTELDEIFGFEPKLLASEWG